jgi:hypothetical protein
MFPRRHAAVELKDTHVGLGVFTRQAFRRQQIIGDICGHIMASATYDSPFCMEFGPDCALEPIGAFRFLNHSCDPNCEIFYYEAARGDDRELPDRLWLGSLRSIAIGEELTIDYAWPAQRAIPCLCGAANCRGWIVASEELTLISSAPKAPSGLADPLQTAKCKMTIWADLRLQFAV